MGAKGDLKLKMEVQLLVKEALAEADKYKETIKQLAEEVKKAAPSSANFSTTINKLEKDTKRAALEASLFGDKLGGLKMEQDSIKGAMLNLIDQGMVPESAALQKLKDQYDETTEKIKNYSDGTDVAASKLENLARTGAALAAARTVQRWATSAVEAFAGAEASADRLDLALELRNMDDAKPAMKALARELQQLAGYSDDLVMQLEAELVAQGKSREETERTIKAAAGLSAVTGDDLNTSVGKLTTMYSGQARAMGSLIPELKDLTDEELEQGKGIDIILSKYEAFIGKTGETQISLARMHESLGDVVEMLGDSMSPQAVLITDLIAKMATSISSTSQGTKDFAGIVSTVVIGALAGLVVKTIAVTAAKWGLFGAEMAVKSAMALGNPLILASIGAVTASAVAVAALVKRKQEEAEALGKGKLATEGATGAYNDMTQAMKDAVTQTGNLADAEKAVTELRKLRAELSSLETTASAATGGVQSSLLKVYSLMNTPVNAKAKNWWEGYKTEAEKFKDVMAAIGDITDKDVLNTIMRSKDVQTAINKGSSSALEIALKNLKAVPQTIQAKIDDLKAQIKKLESGETIKPASAKAGGTITSDAWDDAHKQELFYASLTKSRVDDERLANQKELDLFKGSAEDKKLLDTKLAADLKQLQDDEAKTAGEAADKAAEEAWKLANKQALWEASLTTSKVDDQALANAKELALFKGTAEQKEQLATKLAADLKQLQDDETKAAGEAADKAAEKAFDDAHEQERFDASLTASRVDDQALANAKELALFKGTAENKAKLATKLAADLKQLEDDEAKAAGETADKAAEEAWKLANKQALWESSLTASKVDDLALANAKELALFKGTAEQKEQLATKLAADLKQLQDDEVKAAGEAADKAAEKAFDDAHEQERFNASLTASRVDDQALANAKELALFKGTAENKARLATKLAADLKQLEDDEAKAGGEAADKAAEEAWKLANKQALWEASLTTSKVDDLALANAKELALFKGTAEQKEQLATKLAADLKQLQDDEVKAAGEAADKAAEKAFDDAHEQERFNASLTASRVDDLDLANAKELALFKGTIEDKARLATKLAADLKQLQDDEAKAAGEAADRAAMDAFDAANKSKKFAVELTETRVDDLEFERDRALALFKGTEAEKLALATYYEKLITTTTQDEAERAAQAKIEAIRKVYEYEKSLAYKNKNYTAIAGYSIQEKAKDTEVGKVLGFGGVAAADPMTLLIEAAVDFAMSLESVQKLMNGFSTAIDGAADLIDPLISQGTGDLVNTIVEIGSVLGQIAAPFLSMFVTNLKIATGLINILVVPALKLVGKAFTWLNDNVIVPVGNFFIGMINGVIKLINNALGWLGVHIEELGKIATTTELEATDKAMSDAKDKLSKAMSDLSETFDEKRSDLQDAYNKNISSLQNLLELGAISEADYAARVGSINTQFDLDMASLDEQETAQTAILEDILKELEDGNLTAQAALALAGIPAYADGTPSVPQTTRAVVHKGETIIPESFSQGIRNGDLTLGRTDSGQTIIYKTEVYVSGSVLAEDDLADTIDKVNTRRSGRGFARVS